MISLCRNETRVKSSAGSFTFCPNFTTWKWSGNKSEWEQG